MSLVNEALKKARLEAARQEAARRGVPLPSAGRVRRRPRAGARGWHVAAGATVLLALGAVLFLAGRRSAVPEPAAAAAPTATPSPVTSPAATAPPEAPTAVAQAAEAGPVSASIAERAGGGPPTRSEPPPRSPRSEARPRPEPRPEPVAPAPAAAPEPEPAVRIVTALEPPPPAARATVEIAEHVRELPLPGGDRVVLGGIAWSEERPFVLLNGRVLGTGERIAGLTVVRIEPAGVELRGAAESYFLRLK